MKKHRERLKTTIERYHAATNRDLIVPTLPFPKRFNEAKRKPYTIDAYALISTWIDVVSLKNISIFSHHKNDEWRLSMVPKDWISIMARWIPGFHQLTRNLRLDWIQVPATAVHSRGALNGQTQPLNFTILELVHAVVKTDVMKRINILTTLRRAIGFLCEWGGALTYRGDNLCLDAAEYADFINTTLIGRVGQGLALLYCQRQGYQFFDHYPASPGQQRRKRPDFILQNRDGVKALIESKASASRAPQIKRKLKSALSQLKAGFATLRLDNIKEGYATVANLRSIDDYKDSEAFVTRIANLAPPQTLSETNDDVIIRNNYGTWIRLMGHSSLAAALLLPETAYEGPAMRFALLEIGGRKMAFTPLMPLWMPSVLSLIPLNFLARELWLKWVYVFRKEFHDWPVLAAGVDLANLLYLLRQARRRERLEMRELYGKEAQTHEIGEGAVSTFADTTAFGIIPLGNLLREKEEISV